MLSILSQHRYPKLLRHPAVKGICYNGCVWEVSTPYQSPFETDNTIAHAHTPDDPCASWICFREKKYLYDETIQIHELAHLLSSCEGHREDWFDKTLELSLYHKFNEKMMEVVRRDVVYCFLERKDG